MDGIKLISLQIDNLIILLGVEWFEQIHNEILESDMADMEYHAWKDSLTDEEAEKYLRR